MNKVMILTLILILILTLALTLARTLTLTLTLVHTWARAQHVLFSNPRTAPTREFNNLA